MEKKIENRPYYENDPILLYYNSAVLESRDQLCTVLSAIALLLEQSCEQGNEDVSGMVANGLSVSLDETVEKLRFHFRMEDRVREEAITGKPFPRMAVEQQIPPFGAEKREKGATNEKQA